MNMFFIFLYIIIATPLNIFSAIKDPHLFEKTPENIVVITVKNTPTKTVWEKAQDHKVRTAIGTYTGGLAAVGLASAIVVNLNNKKENKEIRSTCLALAILAGISYWSLQPLFTDEDNNQPAQNNNQH